MPRKTGSTLSLPKMPAGAARSRGKVPPAAALVPIDVEMGDSLTSAKTATERRRAKLMEIELQVRQGDLIPRTEVDRHYFAMARTLRNRVVGIAPRAAAAAFAAKTLGECQRILDRELRLALEALADDVEHGRA